MLSRGSPTKSWTKSVKDSLRKREFYVGQAKRMMRDNNEWVGFVCEKGIFGNKPLNSCI